MPTTDEDIYLLNRMNAVAARTQLGQLISDAETVVGAEISLTSGFVLVGNGSNLAVEVQLSGDLTLNNAGVAAIGSGVIVDADVNAAAGIQFSKLESLTSGHILVGSAGNVATSRAVTGDVSISNAGVAAISSGVIVNANVNTSAAIAYSKLNLLGAILNADIAAGAAIAGTKVSPDFGSQNIVTLGTIAGSNLSGTNTGNITLTAVGASPNANGASLSGQALTLQPADGSTPGVLTAGTQNVGGDKTFTGNIVVSGDLTVNGTTTTSSSTDLVITDKNITVNSGGNDATSSGAGIIVARTSTAGSLIFDATTTSKWKVGLFGSEVEVADVSSSQTLTSKILTGNTAVNLISGSGTLVLNTTGTITAPNATDTLVGKATTDQFSNKTFAQNLLPEANNTRDLGVTGTRWANLWLGGNATVTGNVTATGTLAGSNFSGSSSGTNSGDITLTTVGSTPAAAGASLSGQALTLQPADGSNAGVVSTTTQTFAGAKTFSSAAVFSAGLTGSPGSGVAPIDVTANAARVVIRGTPDASLGLFEIRSASGSNAYMSWTETSGATRGALGFDTTSSTFKFRTASAAGTTLMTLDSSGNAVITGTATASNLSGTNTGNITLATVGSSPAAEGASLSGQVLTLQPADGTNAGVVSITTQTLAGAKTWSGAAKFSSTLTGGGGAASGIGQIETNGTSLTGTNQIAFYTNAYRSTSAATSSTRGFTSNVGTSAASYTSATVSAFTAEITAGAGSAITRAIMFNMENGFTATGTISNRALIADNSTFSGDFVFNISSTNSSTLAGALGVSGAAFASANLGVGVSNVQTGTTQVDFQSRIQGTSAATVEIDGFVATPTTAAAAFVVPILASFKSTPRTKGAGSTITRTIGFYQSSSNTQGTNNAVMADNVAFSGDYFINQTAAKNSVFTVDTSYEINASSSAGSLFSYQAGSVGNQVICRVYNFDNTNAASAAMLESEVGGSSAGDPFLRFRVDSVTDWSIGLDNSDSDKFKISQSSGIGTNDFFTVSTTGIVTIGTGTTAQHALNILLATNGAQVATMTNLPAAATSGNPVGWTQETINGNTRYRPFW